MNRYYIHVFDGETVHPDPEGVEAASLTVAEEIAQDAAREIVAEALKNRKSACATTLMVEDEQKRPLFEINISCKLSTSWLV